MLKKTSPLLAIVIVLMLVVLVPVASAKTAGNGHVARPHIPFTNTDCSALHGPCEIDQFWTGISTHGSGSFVTVDNPAVGTSEYYQKILKLTTSAGAWELVGIDKGDLCASDKVYFVYDYNAASGPTCSAVPTRDINTEVTFQLSYFTSNGGGGFAWIIDCTRPCNPPCNPCGFTDSGLTAKFTESQYLITYVRGSFTGHAVWDDNQFFNNGTWAYDATSGGLLLQDGSNFYNVLAACNNNAISGAPPPPPQACWSEYPNGATNFGGSMETCIYDNAVDNCTVGS